MVVMLWLLVKINLMPLLGLCKFFFFLGWILGFGAFSSNDTIASEINLMTLLGLWMWAWFCLWNYGDWGCGYGLVWDNFWWVMGIEVKSMGFGKWGLLNFLVFCWDLVLRIFCLLGVSFVLILIWRDLEWCTGCLALHVFVSLIYLLCIGQLLISYLKCTNFNCAISWCIMIVYVSVDFSYLVQKGIIY